MRNKKVPGANGITVIKGANGKIVNNVAGVGDPPGPSVVVVGAPVVKPTGVEIAAPNGVGVKKKRVQILTPAQKLRVKEREQRPENKERRAVQLVSLGPCFGCGGRSIQKNPNGEGGACPNCLLGPCVECGGYSSRKNPNGEGGVCKGCLSGPCVGCGGKSSQKNPNGEGGVCKGCLLGSCVGCGGSSTQKNPNGEGGVCKGCLLGSCVGCDGYSKQKNPNGEGGVCQGCLYGSCVGCGGKSAQKNPNGEGGVCKGCLSGPCVGCGGRSQQKNPNGKGGVCPGCLLGPCVECGGRSARKDPNGKGGICQGCLLGFCVGAQCNSQADRVDHLCSFHRANGVDAINNNVGYGGTASLLYLAYWKEHNVVKIGIEAVESSGRRGLWKRQGAEILAAWQLDDPADEIQRKAFYQVEQSIIRILTDAGLIQPGKRHWLTVVKSHRSDGNNPDGYTETFAMDSVEDLSIGEIYLIITDTLAQYGVNATAVNSDSSDNGVS